MNAQYPRLGEIEDSDATPPRVSGETVTPASTPTEGFCAFRLQIPTLNAAVAHSGFPLA
jgi:hypothetical protein